MNGYPGVYIAVLKFRKRDAELEQYIEANKAMRNDHENYTRYCHGYLLPLLKQQRLNGNIIAGKCSIRLLE